MNNKKKMPIDSIGKIIKEAREQEGLRVDDLVWKFNNPKITAKTIKAWESGRQFPDLDMIYKLSEMFNLNPNELLKMKQTIQEESRNEPNWAVRRIGDKLLNFAKPGYKVVSFLSKVILAIILVMVYKYIHATYEATDNPTVLQTQNILGEYLNESDNGINNIVESNIIVK